MALPTNSLWIGGSWWPLRALDGSGLPWPVRCYASDATVPRFTATDGYNKSRTRPVEACVWHWTASENGALQVTETLRKRELGVEFLIDREGVIWQFCDPAQVDTADAGILNSRSCGVEVVSYGFSGGLVFDPLRAMRVPFVPPKGRDRGQYEAVIHGKIVKVARFYPVQLEAACVLAEALSSALPIPRRVPPPENDGTLLSGVKHYAGHLAHSHITERKRDCGPELLQTLRLYFAGATS